MRIALITLFLISAPYIIGILIRCSVKVFRRLLKNIERMIDNE